MLPKDSQKSFLVYKFSSKYVSVWCQEDYLDCTISRRRRTTFLMRFESKCLYISVGRCSKISSGGMVGWCRLNNFLEAALSLVKCFTIFHLIEVLRNSTIFSLSLNNMTIKQQIKYVAIQKVYHLHNGIFSPVQLCHTLSILLYHFLVPFSKLHQETIE